MEDMAGGRIKRRRVCSTHDSSQQAVPARTILPTLGPCRRDAAAALEHIIVEGAKHALRDGLEHLAFLEVCTEGPCLGPGMRCQRCIAWMLFTSIWRPWLCMWCCPTPALYRTSMGLPTGSPRPHPHPTLPHTQHPTPLSPNTYPHTHSLPLRASPSSCARCLLPAPRRCVRRWRRQLPPSNQPPATRTGRHTTSSWSASTSGPPRWAGCRLRWAVSLFACPNSACPPTVTGRRCGGCARDDGQDPPLQLALPLFHAATRGLLSCLLHRAASSQR